MGGGEGRKGAVMEVLGKDEEVKALSVNKKKELFFMVIDWVRDF